MTTGLPVLSFQVAFSGTQGGNTVPAAPNDPTITPTWTDLTHRLLKVETKRGKSYELDEGQANDLTFVFRNKDGALDPTNTASPFYPYILPNRQFRWQVTYNSVTYTLATGFIKAWPQTWRLHGYLGEVQATGSDALGALSQMLLPSCLAAEILLDNPVGYWPLTEPTGAVQGANDAATSAGPMVIANTGAGGSVAFGVTTLTGLVGAGASNGLTGPVQGNTTGVEIVNGSSVNFSRIQGSLGNVSAQSRLSLEAWIQNVTLAYDPVIRVLGGAGNSPDFLVLQSDASGNAEAVVVIDNIVAASVTSAVRITDGKLHHLAVTCDLSPARVVTLYVDGVVAGSSTMLSAATRTWSSADATFANGDAANATVAQIAVYLGSVLSGSRVAAHYNAGVNAFPETSGQRFTRILGYGPWNLGSTVPTGDTNLAGLTDCQGKSVLQALLDVCTAEGGNLYVDHQGRIVFENRHNRMTQTQPQWVLGENTAAGEIPYGGDIQVDYDDDNMFNTLVMQRPGGASYNFFDAVSLLENFARAFPTDPMQIPIDTDQNLFYMGQFLVNRYKQAFPRVSTITFNPTSNPSLWPFIGSVQIGQRVTVNRRPRDATSPIGISCFVESVDHNWDASTGDFITTLELSPAGWQNYQLLTAARGSLHTATTVGATTFVVDVTPTTGNTLAQDGWQTGCITSIEIVDGANTETLTVASITTSGSQATITTAAGAAHAHAATVVVAEAFPAGDTYNEFDPAAILNGLEQLAY